MYGRRSLWAATLLACATLTGAAVGAQVPPPTHVYWNGISQSRSDERPSSIMATMGRHFVQVLDLRWSTWGDENALGTGKLRTPATTFGREPDVNVTLHDRVDCFGTAIYTAWTLAMPDGAMPPSDFAQARAKLAPCRLGPCPGGRASCRITTGFRDRAMPPDVLRSKGWLFLMDVRHGDRATATVTEFLERNRRFGDPRSIIHHWIYPIRIQLSRPRWCSGSMMRTRMTITAYGAGVEHDSHVYLAHPHLPSRAQRRRLLKDITRSGAAKHRQTTTRCATA
ncbi:MAG TPA: hypothetical protein VFY45_07660 [Baekduia sp.]|nr:hypothetical protein [Baekduia sp.]